MIQQPDLFDRYPSAPGHSRDDTSRAAAEDMRSRVIKLRHKVLTAVRAGRMTVHECAAMMGESVPSVQPRFSELRAFEMIEDSGERRINAASGKKAIVWRAVVR